MDPDEKPKDMFSTDDNMLRVIPSEDDIGKSFKVKKTTALGHLMTVYCVNLNLQKNLVCFVFDGVRINDSDTPLNLDMINNDIIEFFYKEWMVACYVNSTNLICYFLSM